MQLRPSCPIATSTAVTEGAAEGVRHDCGPSDRVAHNLGWAWSGLPACGGVQNCDAGRQGRRFGLGSHQTKLLDLLVPATTHSLRDGSASVSAEACTCRGALRSAYAYDLRDMTHSARTPRTASVPFARWRACSFAALAQKRRPVHTCQWLPGANLMRALLVGAAHAGPCGLQAACMPCMPGSACQHACMLAVAR